MRDGKAVFLALDWARAFDSISPDALVRALKRFGIPDDFVSMIQAIYSDRRFCVNECGKKSQWRKQRFGISQGCPLSPFLFVILMTILRDDAKHAASSDPSYTKPPFPSELVYADDTLIMAVNEDSAHAYMTCISLAGSEYGLSFNWKKLEVLPVRTHGTIKLPDGSQAEIKQSLKYVGSGLFSDGRIGTEIGRRMGLAKSDFEVLRRVWVHAQISNVRKLYIFNACIVSELAYGLMAGEWMDFNADVSEQTCEFPQLIAAVFQMLSLCNGESWDQLADRF